MSESSRNPPVTSSVYPQERAIERLEAAQSPYAATEPIGQRMEWITPYLNAIDPEVGDKAMRRVVTEVFRNLDGDVDGVTLIEYWIKRGGGNHTRAEIESMWSEQNLAQEKPGPVASTINTVDENGGGEPVLDSCGSETIMQPVLAVMTISTPLDKYSLRDMVPTLEACAIAAIAVLGQLVLMGQFTIFFAAANTGKTLLMLYLLVEAIKQGRVDPSKVFYIDMDDNRSGLLEKLRIASELGFHILAEGYRDFSVKKFMVEITAMIEHDQANGVIVILDTYKKFANVMDKSQSSQFNQMLRRFVMKGGTVVALAHTNKKLGINGKPVYGGTSDALDDCDCAYTIRSVQSQDDTHEKVVEVENIKGRGGVMQQAVYVYSVEPGISYDALLASVQPVADAQSTPLKRATQLKADERIIAAVVSCIREGIDAKMKLRDAVAERTGVSLRDAVRVIEAHTGDDPELHRWTFSVGQRGAKVFVLLDIARPSHIGEAPQT